MFICRLFDRDHPFEQVEARVISEGETTIGRDADWSLPDVQGVLSRIHLTLSLEGERLFARDGSTNGTYLPNGQRMPPGAAHELKPNDVLVLGGMKILVDRPVGNVDATIATSTPELSTVRSEGARGDASLLEAFCDGARIDASSLSSEDPHELMRRLGAIYQQTITGLAGLMAERARLKGDYDLERTTIGAAANNPFKWTPPRKLARDLLSERNNGFLSGPAAVCACFDDLTTHMTALSDTADATLKQALQMLSPEAIETEAKAQTSLLRSRQAVCWEILVRRHAECVGTSRPSAGG